MDSKVTPENAPKKEKNQNIQVFVRVRPMNTQESAKNGIEVIDTPGTKEVVVRERSVANLTKTFTFDRVFGPRSKQVDVYKTVVSPLLNEVLLGYNCTVFAYGQTGTGKTFTMEGERSVKNDARCVENDPLAGILPRALSQLFDEVRMMNCEFTVRVSFLELYNEELFDLLAPIDENKTRTLRLFEDSHRKGSVIIQGLEEVIVQNKHEVYAVLDRGSQQRKTAATLMNASSSRSHTVFTITVHMKESSVEGEEMLKVGKLHLVDLAGSENIGKSGAVDKRAREAGSINQSLLTLGRVISALVERTPHIPYRESKLTRLLQDSLGGKTKTSIIATISPAAMNIEETLSTLDYAHRAKNIMNRPEVNQRLTKKEALNIYTEEIERLRRDLNATRDKNGIFMDLDNYNRTMCQIESQHRELNEKSKKISDLEDNLTSKEDELRETTDMMSELKLDLQTKQTILEETQLRKKALESKLLKAERRIDELRHLVDYHVKTEEKMNSEASYLLNTATDTVSIIEALHGRLERKQVVEERNWKNADRFRGEFRQSVEELSTILSGMREAHSIHTSKLRGRLNDRSRERSEKVENFIKNFTAVTTYLESVDHTLVEISSNFVTATQEKFASSGKTVKYQCEKTAMDYVDFAMEVRNVLEECKEFVMNIFTEAKNMKTELESNFTEMEQCVLDTVQENDDRFDRLQGYLKSMKETWISYVDQVTTRWKALETEQSKYKESHAKRVLLMEQQLAAMKTDMELLEEESNGAIMEFTENTDNVRNTWDGIMSDAIDVTGRAKESLDGTKTKIPFFREDIIVNSAESMEKLQNHLRKASVRIKTTEHLIAENQSAHLLGIKNVAEAYNEASEEVGNCVGRLSRDMALNLQYHASQLSKIKEESMTTVRALARGEDAMVEDVMKRLDDHCDTISDSTSKICSGLHQTAGSVDEFWEETYLTDTPSGATPCRRKYEFPSKLSVPSPQERVLARYHVFRKDVQVAIDECDEDESTTTSDDIQSVKNLLLDTVTVDTDVDTDVGSLCGEAGSVGGDAENTENEDPHLFLQPANRRLDTINESPETSKISLPEEKNAKKGEATRTQSSSSVASIKSDSGLSDKEAATPAKQNPGQGPIAGKKNKPRRKSGGRKNVLKTPNKH